MNNILQKIIAKLPKRPSRGLTKKESIHPTRDWFIALLIFTLVTVAGGVFSAKLFIDYSDLDVSVADQEVTVPKYSADLNQEALEKFRAKNEVYQSLEAKPDVVEPIADEGQVADVPESESATSTENTATSTVDIETEMGEGEVAVPPPDSDVSPTPVF